MSVTNAPLEKQLVNLDMSKGMDERTRPELMTGFTTIENLVQDQTGAWVKRPGTLAGLGIDGPAVSGAAINLPKKVLALLTGWGVIADGGYLYHKQDSQATMRARQQHMDFSVTRAAYNGSSGPASLTAAGAGNVIGVASCDTHNAYVIAQGTKQKLCITEKATGVEYVYDIGLITYPGAAAGPNLTAGTYPVFVANRYLHVYVPSAGLVNMFVVVIDVLGTMPTTEAGITTIGTASVAATTGGGVASAVGGTTHSYAIIPETAGRRVVKVVGATGVVANSTVPANDYDAMDLNETTSTLWLLAVSAASCRVIGLSSTTVSTITTATYLTTVPGTYLASDSTNKLCIVYTAAIAFGGSTIRELRVYSVPTAGAAGVAVGATYGWITMSNPFWMSGSNKFYIHLQKQDTTSTVAGHVIADLSTFTGYNTNVTPLLPYGSFRLACNLEPYAGLASTTTTGQYRMRSYNGYELSAFVPYQTAQRTFAAAFLDLRLSDSSAYGSANFSGSTMLAHGGLNAYDGRNLFEQGMVDYPVVNVAVGAAGALTGSFRYVAVFRHVDANGASTYSRTYGPVAAVNVATRNTVTIQPYGITNRNSAGLDVAGKPQSNGDSIPYVELYRTKNGGTIYYLCATSATGIASSPTSSVQQITASAAGLLSVTDNLADATLGAQAVMYRQPGTTNAPADRYASPACKMVIQHKDRLFCVDPYGQRVYYSSFFVDGECAWFNPTFNFFVHAGTGPITALASMDGRLFVFKRDAIFVVDGDGPGESGPTGNEFAPPQSLASRYGCIDHRSLVLTPEGILYRSTRGIEKLTRSLKVEWIGERVQNTVLAYPTVTGACVGPDARVHFSLSTTETYAGVGSSTGVELVYDIPADCWSTAKYTGYIGTYGQALQGIGIINEAGIEKVAYVDSVLGVYVYDDTVSTDYGGNFFVPWTIETGWIKQGPQARQRVSDLLFLAKRVTGSNHAIKLSLAFDYSSTYTQTKTFEPTTFGTSIEELDIQPATQQVLAIRIKIEDQAPANTATYPVGTGKGSDIIAITAEVAAKLGAPKLASGQKA